MLHFFGMAHEVENPTLLMNYRPDWDKIFNDEAVKSSVVIPHEKREINEKNVIADIWYILKTHVNIPESDLLFSLPYDVNTSMSANEIVLKHFFTGNNIERITVSDKYEYPKLSPVDIRFLNLIYPKTGIRTPPNEIKNYRPLRASDLISPGVRERILANERWMKHIKDDNAPSYFTIPANFFLKNWILTGEDSPVIDSPKSATTTYDIAAVVRQPPAIQTVLDAHPIDIIAVDDNKPKPKIDTTTKKETFLTTGFILIIVGIIVFIVIIIIIIIMISYRSTVISKTKINNSI